MIKGISLCNEILFSLWIASFIITAVVFVWLGIELTKTIREYIRFRHNVDPLKEKLDLKNHKCERSNEQYKIDNGNPIDDSLSKAIYKTTSRENYPDYRTDKNKPTYPRTIVNPKNQKKNTDNKHQNNSDPFPKIWLFHSPDSTTRETKLTNDSHKVNKSR